MNCRYMVKEYNRFVGEVDLLNGLIGRRIDTKPRFAHENGIFDYGIGLLMFQ